MLKKQRIQADANSARLETHHDSHVQSAPLPAHRPGHSTNHALGLTYPATTTFPTPTHAGRCMWCCSCHAAELWGGGAPPPASSCHCCRTVHNYINRDHPTAPIATTGPYLPHTHHDFTISRRCRTNGLLGSRNTPAPFSLVHNMNARTRVTRPGPCPRQASYVHRVFSPPQVARRKPGGKPATSARWRNSWRPYSPPLSLCPPADVPALIFDTTREADVLVAV